MGQGGPAARVRAVLQSRAGSLQRIVLRERPRPLQWVGIVAAVGGVVLLGPTS
jgi:drug/metabolite transporter (DMT)-like permease